MENVANAAIRLMTSAKTARPASIMETPPEITVGAFHANSTLVPSVTVAGPSFLGSYPVLMQRGNNVVSGSNMQPHDGNWFAPHYIGEPTAPTGNGWGIHFETDAPAVEVCLRNNLGTKIRFRIDGVWATEGDIDCSEAGNDGSGAFYVKCSLGSVVKSRRWQIYFSATTEYRGIVVGVPEGSEQLSFQIWTTYYDYGYPKIVIAGDENVLGVGTSTTRSGFGYQLAELLGGNNCICVGIEGQGYVAASASNLSAPDTLLDITRYGHSNDYFLLAGVVLTFGMHDMFEDSANLAKKVALVTSTVRDMQPEAFVFAMPILSPLAPNAQRYIDIMEAAFIANADNSRMWFFDPIENRFFGPNRSGDYFQDNDIHLNDAGHHYVAQRLRALILRMLATKLPQFTPPS